MSKKKVRPAGLGIRCVVAEVRQRCERCASGECTLCGTNGWWVRTNWPGKPLCAQYTMRVFWELRVRHSRANVLRTRALCAHCDELEYSVLNSAAQLTKVMMEKVVKGGVTAENSFWWVLVNERETEFGTNWEACPGCGESHSVHTTCGLVMSEEKE